MRARLLGLAKYIFIYIEVWLRFSKSVLKFALYQKKYFSKFAAYLYLIRPHPTLSPWLSLKSIVSQKTKLCKQNCIDFILEMVYLKSVLETRWKVTCFFFPSYNECKSLYRSSLIILHVLLGASRSGRYFYCSVSERSERLP